MKRVLQGFSIQTICRNFNTEVIAAQSGNKQIVSRIIVTRYFLLVLLAQQIGVSLWLGFIQPARYEILASNTIVTICLIAAYAALRLRPSLNWPGAVTIFGIIAVMFVVAPVHAGHIPPAFMTTPLVALMAVLLLTGVARSTALTLIAIAIAYCAAWIFGPFGTPPPEPWGGWMFLYLLMLGLASALTAVLGHLFAREREIAIQVAAEQANRLERAEKARINFIAAMNHDIRTPMNGILGALQVLETSKDTARTTEITEVIRDSALSLALTLDDLLNLSDASRGQFVVTKRPFDIDLLSERALRLWRGRASDKNLILNFSVDDRRAEKSLPLVVEIDTVRIHQLLSSLLSRAVRVTESGTIDVVETRSDEPNGRVRISYAVRDRGPALPPASSDDLFRFFEVGYPASTTAESADASLSMARMIARAMGGDLMILETSSEGSVLSVWLTVDISAQTAPMTRTIPVQSGQSRQVLCVDDHPYNLMIVSTLLKSLGFHAEMAASGEKALKMCAAKTYDAILMDVLMPGMDGVETTRAILEGDGPNAATPIIAMTANTLPEQVRAYLAAGMTGVIAKPFEVRALVQELLSAMHDQADDGAAPA